MKWNTQWPPCCCSHEGDRTGNVGKSADNASYKCLLKLFERMWGEILWFVVLILKVFFLLLNKRSKSYNFVEERKAPWFCLSSGCYKIQWCLLPCSTRVCFFSACQCRKVKWCSQCCWIIPKLVSSSKCIILKYTVAYDHWRNIFWN